jgi:glycosyltransferase involved in cell wall biosynthesis
LEILVSINCITYNQEKYISKAIDSFLMQKTKFRFEILIGEDASTDNTGAIVNEYEVKYPDMIRVVTDKKNVGAVVNESRLIEKSKGKYIALCEGDDYWTDENKLQKQVDYMENNPDCSLCFHSVEMIKENDPHSGILIRPYMNDTKSRTEDIIIGGGGFCPTASLFFPSRYLHDLPDFYFRSHVGDYPLQMYLAAIGYAYYIDECMAVYRTGVKGSWTSKPKTLKRTEAKKHYNCIYKKDIILLNEFNEYTHFKYNDAVKETIKRREFEILINNADIKAMKNSQNKDLYEKLGTYRILKIYLDKYFPFIYDIKNQLFKLC